MSNIISGSDVINKMKERARGCRQRTILDGGEGGRKDFSEEGTLLTDTGDL